MGKRKVSHRAKYKAFRQKEFLLEKIMPKLKTHKGIKKRFRVTGTGKVKHRHSGTSHLAYRLTKKQRRHLRGTGVVATMEAKKIIKALAGNFD